MKRDFYSLLWTLIVVFSCGNGAPNQPDGDLSDSDVDSRSDVGIDTDIEDEADALAHDGDVASDTDAPFDADEEIGPAWRSTLYPENWAPDFTDAEGRFLHDFSYAGYRGGSVPLGAAVPDLVVDVVSEHGADPTGANDSTEAVQAAIDTVQNGGGGVVFFPVGLYRFDGQLHVSASNIVLRGTGAATSRLYFTSSDAMDYRSHITVAGSLSTDVELPLHTDSAARSFVVEVDDAGSWLLVMT